jgi:hypothetical protein
MARKRKELDFCFDVPLVFRLDGAPGGALTESGDFKYTCNNDSCIFWLPAAGRQALLAAGVQAGDTVQIVKSLRGVETVFMAERLAEQAGLFAVGGRAAAAASGSAGERAAGSASTAAAALLPARVRAPELGGGLGALAGGVSLEDFAELCLKASARANWQVWSWARNGGMELPTPLWSDVRAYAHTLFIELRARG